MVRKLAALKQRLGHRPASSGYRILSRYDALGASSSAWAEFSVAQRQHAAYQALLADMRAGRPRQDLAAAAEAVRLTGMEHPSLLEVGCGSGYYAEILRFLLPTPLRYVGMDLSPTMIQLARSAYPRERFLIGDARALPFIDDSFSIVLNGVSLMHIPEFELALRESCRVAKSWLVIHSVPVARARQTTYLSKLAYGHQTTEILFNESELLNLVKSMGAKVCHVLPSIEYNLVRVVNEPTTAKTFVCQIVR